MISGRVFMPKPLKGSVFHRVLIFPAPTRVWFTVCRGKTNVGFFISPQFFAIFDDISKWIVFVYYFW